MLSEDRLITFWNPPSETEMWRIKSTKDQIEEFLKKNLNIDEIKKNYSLDSFNYEVYLQGSYSNSTNVSFSSDVDIVIEFTWIYYSRTNRLNSSELDLWNKWFIRSDSDYSIIKFKDDIFNLFNISKWNPDYKPKCIKLPWNTYRVDADIVPCFTFKDFYSSIEATKWIKIINTDTKDIIINFPKIHGKNMNIKNANTNKKFKRVIRIFKSIRREMIDKSIIEWNFAPWYFIENLIYNIPNTYFDNYSNRAIFEEIINYCWKLDNFMFSKCANWIDDLLWGNMWKEEDLLTFIYKVKNYYLNN